MLTAWPQRWSGPILVADARVALGGLSWPATRLPQRAGNGRFIDLRRGSSPRASAEFGAVFSARALSF
jgi:hypothetical protein